MGWLNKAVGAGVGYALAGPGGAVAGVVLAGTDDGGYDSGYDSGYDMGDIPYAVHVEADHEDDELGRRWTLRFLSAVPPGAHAQLRLMTDDAIYLRGHAPFADEEGQFLAVAPIRGQRAVVYVPFGAAQYTSPKNLSLEVAVSSVEPSEAANVGTAVLDARFPPGPAWNVADYVVPLISLGVSVMRADGAPDEPSLAAMVSRLAEELGAAPGVPDDAMSAAMRARALEPLSIDEAVRVARFRFPGVTAVRYRNLLQAACEAAGELTASQTAKLDEIEALLIRAVVGAGEG